MSCLGALFAAVKNLPPVTKIYWTAAVATTILTSVGALSAAYLYLDFDLVFGKFQVRFKETETSRQVEP